MNESLKSIKEEIRKDYPYINREELISILAKLADKYPIGFIEDALQEEDFEGYARQAR